MGRHLPVLARVLADRRDVHRKQPAAAVTGGDLSGTGHAVWRTVLLSECVLDYAALRAGTPSFTGGRGHLRVGGVSEGLDSAAAGAACQLF